MPSSNMPSNNMPSGTMTLSILVAMDEDGVIGRDGDLPWRLPADLKRVKALTTGQTLIMGRKTFDSIGRPLPHRRSIIISRNPDLRIEGAEVVGDFDDALTRARQPDAHGHRGDGHRGDVFVFGGAEIFRLALPVAQRLYLTRVHAHVEGDVSFPAWEPAAWRLIDEVRHPADAQHDHDYTFQEWHRRT